MEAGCRLQGSGFLWLSSKKERRRLLAAQGDGGETPPGGLLCSPWCSEGPEMGAVAAVQEGISACFVVEGGGELELDLG